MLLITFKTINITINSTTYLARGTINPRSFYNLTLPPETPRFPVVKFDNDNTGLLAYTSGYRVKILNISSNLSVFELTANSSQSLNALKFNNRGLIVIGEEFSGIIRLYNVKTGLLVHSMSKHSANCFDFDNTDLLASASLDQNIKLWNVTTGSLVKTLSDYTSFYSVAFDNKGLVFGGSKDKILVFNVSTGEKPIKQLAQPFNENMMGFISFLRFDPTGLLVSGQSDKTIRIWTNNNVIRKININFKYDSSNFRSYIRDQSYAIDNTGLVAFCYYYRGDLDRDVGSYHIQIHDYLTGALVAELSPKQIYQVDNLRFDDKGLLMFGSQDGTVKFWKLSN